MKLVAPARGALALLAVAGLIAAGCGGSDSSSGASSDAPAATTAGDATNSQEAASTRTIFDADFAALTDSDLPAIEVDVGGGKTIRFEEGEKPRIAYVGFGLGYDYTVPQYDSARRTAAEAGYELDTFDPAGDGQKQVQQLQDIMSTGRYRIVVTYPVVADLACDLLRRQLVARNILVVAHNQAACDGDTETDGIVATVWDPNTPRGLEAWAKLIADAQGGEGAKEKAIILTGPEVDTSSNDAVAGLERELGAAGVEIVSIQRTDYTPPDSQKKAQDALQANPDATMIVSTFPEGTRGAMTALKMAGKEGKLRVYDLGGSKKTIAEIQQGLIHGSTPLYPATVARSAVQAAILARAGKEVPRAVFNAGIDGIAEDEVPWITGENASAFTAEH